MKTEKKWYAVYTRPRWEKKVAELLGRRKVEHFCPLNRVLRQWADRKKVVHEPLFTSYVFVHVAESEMLSIRQTDGVLNFVHWLGAPAEIRADEIEAVKSFLEGHSDVQLEKIRVNVSERVRITEGLLVNREGDVLEVRNKTVKVLLPSLGYAMVAEVSRSSIETVQYPQAYSNQNHYNAKAI